MKWAVAIEEMGFLTHGLQVKYWKELQAVAILALELKMSTFLIIYFSTSFIM